MELFAIPRTFRRGTWFDDIKEGCSIIEKQAEILKIKFGSAWWK
jgi:hypothetical protein